MLWLWVIIWRVRCMDQLQIDVPMVVNQGENLVGTETDEIDLPRFDKRIWQSFSKIGIFGKNSVSSTELYGPKSKAFQFLRIRFISVSYMIAYIYSLINPILLFPSVAVFKPTQTIDHYSGGEGDQLTRLAAKAIYELCCFEMTLDITESKVCSQFPKCPEPPSAQGNNISLWGLDWVWMYVFLFNTIGCFKCPGKHGKCSWMKLYIFVKNLSVFLIDYFRGGWYMLNFVIVSVIELLYFVSLFFLPPDLV